MHAIGSARSTPSSPTQPPANATLDAAKRRLNGTRRRVIHACRRIPHRRGQKGPGYERLNSIRTGALCEPHAVRCRHRTLYPGALRNSATSTLHPPAKTYHRRASLRGSVIALPCSHMTRFATQRTRSAYLPHSTYYWYQCSLYYVQHHQSYYDYFSHYMCSNDRGLSISFSGVRQLTQRTLTFARQDTVRISSK